MSRNNKEFKQTEQTLLWERMEIINKVAYSRSNVVIGLSGKQVSWQADKIV